MPVTLEHRSPQDQVFSAIAELAARRSGDGAALIGRAEAVDALLQNPAIAALAAERAALAAPPHDTPPRWLANQFDFFTGPRWDRTCHHFGLGKRRVGATGPSTRLGPLSDAVEAFPMSVEETGEACAGGVAGTPCGRPPTTYVDGVPLCAPHVGGRRARRPGGALNDNGKPRSLYLLRRGVAWKVGLATNVSARVRAAVAADGPDVRHLATVRLPGTHLGFDGPVAHCIEHSVRLHFAMLSITGVMLNDPGPEWVSADPDQTDDFGTEAFRLAVDWVLMAVEDSMLIRQGRPERWRLRAGGSVA